MLAVVGAIRILRARTVSTEGVCAHLASIAAHAADSTLTAGERTLDLPMRTSKTYKGLLKLRTHHVGFRRRGARPTLDAHHSICSIFVERDSRWIRTEFTGATIATEEIMPAIAFGARRPPSAG